GTSPFTAKARPGRANGACAFTVCHAPPPLARFVAGFAALGGYRLNAEGLLGFANVPTREVPATIRQRQSVSQTTNADRPQEPAIPRRPRGTGLVRLL